MAAAMSSVVEKDWITKSGLRAVALLVRGSHRCGYVGVPKEHALYEKEYDYHLDKDKWDALKSSEEIFKGSPIDVLLASHERGDNVGPRLSYFVNVHGGITYAGGGKSYPVAGEEWWFGFDCAHLGDARMNDTFGPDPGAVVRSLEYVEAECESLAAQLAALK